MVCRTPTESDRDWGFVSFDSSAHFTRISISSLPKSTLVHRPDTAWFFPTRFDFIFHARAFSLTVSRTRLITGDSGTV